MKRLTDWNLSHTVKKVGGGHYYSVAKFVEENTENILKIYDYIM